jgi:hypothetical protein
MQWPLSPLPPGRAVADDRWTALLFHPLNGPLGLNAAAWAGIDDVVDRSIPYRGNDRLDLHWSVAARTCRRHGRATPIPPRVLHLHGSLPGLEPVIFSATKIKKQPKGRQAGLEIFDSHVSKDVVQCTIDRRPGGSAGFLFSLYSTGGVAGLLKILLGRRAPTAFSTLPAAMLRLVCQLPWLPPEVSGRDLQDRRPCAAAAQWCVHP